MAQSTKTELSNQPKNLIRGDLNELIKASYTMWAGSLEPIPAPTGSDPKSASYMWWNDTDTKTIKLRNAENTDWYIMLDYSNLTLLGSSGEGLKPYKTVCKDIEISSETQTLFDVGEEYKEGSLRVFRNGVLVKFANFTESNQSLTPGEFSFDSDYISDYNFDLISDWVQTVYEKYI